jgi:hypothetical protein
MSHHTTTKPSMSTTALKQGVMNGSIASAVSDTGATSTVGAPHVPFEDTTTSLPKYSSYPQVAQPRQPDSQNFCAMYGHQPTWSTLSHPLVKLFSVAANLLMPDILWCMTKQKSTSTMLTPFTSQRRWYLRAIAAHAQDYGAYLYDQSSQMRTKTH